ncbi:hypothetical protein KIN20_015976 [Parelaphostrongylus tenuis]|uniref:DNA-directed primase/polymerase protein n=1 Tax=Parelaphostrongylus tenuis TaxID=148309 RepID=A0AAD5QQE9_PARTN|nr:hypothetical protein KIN20_015976 [Parelaphostrongylus tenuis]
MSIHSKPIMPTSDGDAEDSFDDSVHLDDSWFYGPPKKKQTLSYVGKENFIPATLVDSRHSSLVEKSFGDMETFSKQRLAIAKLEESTKVFKNSRIFSFEKPGQTNGERRYLVSTLERFWSWYETLKDRHLYELINESSPCRLYFDLEYSKITNTDIDHETVYNYFMNTVRRLLHDEFDIDVDPAKDFLVLDSSTESKFSAHVICHLPNGYLFPSNVHIRPFCARLSKILLESSQKIWNADGNRSIRQRSDTILKVADYCTFYGPKKPCDRQVFYDSLCIPANAFEFPLLKMKDIVENELQNFQGFPKFSSIKSREGSGPSPFIQLDEFMLMVWRKWNHSVYIRQWKVASDANEERIATITYYPANCRYCFNIGREHKSNGTFWTVNLHRNDFNQKCFDPDCRGTSSNFFPLPSFIANSIHTRAAKGVDSEENNDASFFDEDDVVSFFDESQIELNDWFAQWDDVLEQ